MKPILEFENASEGILHKRESNSVYENTPISNLIGESNFTEHSGQE